MKFGVLALLVASAAAFTSPAQRSVATMAPRTISSIKPLEMTVTVGVRPSEAVDSVIMRLRREVNKSGHLRKLRTKRFFEDAREKKKRKVAEARRAIKFQRQRKRRNLAQAP